MSQLQLQLYPTGVSTDPRTNSLATADAGLVPGIAGLSYTPEFVDEGAERRILSELDSSDWSQELKRRVQHFGYKYDYKARRIDPSMYVGPLPPWIKSLSERLVCQGIFAHIPDQVIANEYVPGQGISRHVDCEPCFGDTVASLSLGSDCVMDFYSLKDSRHQPVVLQRRSLVVLQGDARYRWLHAIAARKSDRVGSIVIERARRVSLTFRCVVRP